MSEFSPQPAPVPPAYTPPPNVEQHWLKRPIVMGQSIPWLALYALILIAAGIFFFRPEPGASTSGRAFGSQDLQSAPLSFDTASSVPASSSGSMAQAAASASSLAQMQNEVAAMIATIRTHSDVNRQAIEQMALKVNAMADTEALLKQQVSELQAQAALQSAHNLVAPSTPVRRMVAVAAKPHPVAPSSPLAGMHLSALQNGMAWVQWQDKTWAVEVGDTVGPVTVTGIDAPSRLVHTSAGTLQ